MQHGLAQGGEAGVRVLVGHVGLGGDLEDFTGLAFRGGDDDLESEARQHREGALRVTAVGLDERLVKEERRVGRLELVVHAAAEQVDQRRAVHERGQLLQGAAGPSAGRGDAFDLPVRVAHERVERGSAPRVEVAGAVAFHAVDVPDLPDLAAQHVDHRGAGRERGVCRRR